MWLQDIIDKIFKRPEKPRLMRRLRRMFKKLTSMNKHLPDVSKKNDILLNDLKFNLGIEILRLRGKVSNSIDELEYDSITTEKAKANLSEIHNEFMTLRLKFKSLAKQAR